MFKLVIAIAAVLCGWAIAPLRAEAMSPVALAPVRAAIQALSPVETAACGWYPSGYPQSWAVYNRGWGCRYVYPGYNLYVDRPYYDVSSRPVYRRPYWRPRTWWWAWY